MAEPKKETSAEQGRVFIAAVAARHGYTVNPEPETVELLAAGLATNRNRYGFYQCPCRDSWSGDRERDRDIACPCVYCAEDQAEFGYCYCGLFLTGEFAKSGRIVRPIPERRPADRFPS